MARTLYGGSPADVIAQVNNDSGDPTPDFGPTSAVSLTAWDSVTGGTQLTSLQDFAGSAISQVTPDSIGRVLFWGPDAYADAIWLQDSSGNRWRINPADLAGRVAPTWTTIPGKPAVIAAADTAANARAAISAGVDTLLTTAEAATGADTNPRQVTPAVFKAAAQAAALTASNTYTMPVWDGTGTQPTRPTGLPAGSVVVWRQPTAPPLDATHAKAADRWATT